MYMEIYLRCLCMDEEQCFSLQQCFADERDNIFETTSWNTYLRYVTTNRNLVYVLVFIVLVFAIEVKRIGY